MSLMTLPHHGSIQERLAQGEAQAFRTENKSKFQGENARNLKFLFSVSSRNNQAYAFVVRALDSRSVNISPKQWYLIHEAEETSSSHGQKSDIYIFSVLDVPVELLYVCVFAYSLEMSKSHLPTTDSALPALFLIFMLQNISLRLQGRYP